MRWRERAKGADECPPLKRGRPDNIVAEAECRKEILFVGSLGGHMSQENFSDAGAHIC